MTETGQARGRTPTSQKSDPQGAARRRRELHLYVVFQGALLTRADILERLRGHAGVPPLTPEGRIPLGARQVDIGGLPREGDDGLVGRIWLVLPYDGGYGQLESDMAEALDWKYESWQGLYEPAGGLAPNLNPLASDGSVTRKYRWQKRCETLSVWATALIVPVNFFIVLRGNVILGAVFVAISAALIVGLVIAVRQAEREYPRRTRSAVAPADAVRFQLCLDHVLNTRCCGCGYDLHGIDTCRCPECGLVNYYLTDRADAAAVAEAHGAVLLSRGPDRQTWLPPWEVASAESAAGLAKALRREAPRGHVLYGARVRAIGRRRDNDDVLFAVGPPGTSFAVVHLTWAARRGKQKEIPWTVMYDTWADFVEGGMKPDHEEYVKRCGNLPDNPPL